MKLNYFFICFLIFISFAKHHLKVDARDTVHLEDDQQNNFELNDNQHVSTSNQQTKQNDQHNEAKSIKQSVSDENKSKKSKIEINDSSDDNQQITEQQKTINSNKLNDDSSNLNKIKLTNDKLSDNDKSKIVNDKLNDKLNDDSNEELNEEQVDKVIYIKIKSLNDEELDNEFTKEDQESKPIKDSPVRKTLNFRNQKDENNENIENDDSKEKEIVISTAYPTIDFLKVEFKKNEDSKKNELEEDNNPAPVELTKEQQLGKQIFEDALTKIEMNPDQAYKLIDHAAMLGYKEAEDFLLHGLVFGDFEVGLDTIKGKLDYFTRKGNPLAQMVCQIIFLIFIRN